jgi:molybdopterin molybdotransferase
MPSLPESASLSAAFGRVLAEDVASEIDVPGFDRAMMDGYAVVAGDTLGASPYNRLRLAVVGEIAPGERPSRGIGAGQAVRIMTGAPVPPGADAVLPAEMAEGAGEFEVYAVGDVSPGKNIGRRGEDVARGTRVLSAGRVLRPQDLGVLSSIGRPQVNVVRRPRVRILCTGSELLPPGSRPVDWRIADANGPMLAALATRDGGETAEPRLVPDDPSAILDGLREPADVVLVSGGSSVGREDHAPRVLAEQGELAVHGVAMRPSSPAGMGRFGERLVFLLPGNPVSCLCAYDFFAGRAIRAVGGRSKAWPYASVRRRLTRKLVSVVGRVDYARVRFARQGIEPVAVAGASILSSTTRADGFVVVPSDSEGYPAGTEVNVFLYDEHSMVVPLPL